MRLSISLPALVIRFLFIFESRCCIWKSRAAVIGTVYGHMNSFHELSGQENLKQHRNRELGIAEYQRQFYAYSGVKCELITT